MKSSNFGIQLFWIVSLYTRLDKSYTIFLPNIIFLTVLFINSSFFLSVNPWCTWQWRILYKITKKVYIQQYFKFIVRKLEIRPVPLFFFFKPTLIHSCLYANVFHIQCLICYTSVIRWCATSIEAEGVQRPHANTSQVIFFFFLLFLKFYCSLFFPPFQVTLNPKEPPLLFVAEPGYWCW